MTRRLFSPPGPPRGAFTLNRASVQARGLLLWYPTLGYNATTTLPELASSGRFGGTMTGPPGLRRDAAVGMGMDFTGSERWEVSHISSLSTTTRTVSAWVIADATPSTHTIVKKDTEYILRCDGTTLDWYVWTSSGLSSCGTTISNGVLYHVAATWDGTTARLYVNGVQKNSSTPGGTTSTSANNWTIGAQSGGGEAWDGLIADVRLYNIALSADEIFQLYAPQTRWELYRPLNDIAFYRPPVAADAGLTPLVSLTRDTPPLSTTVSHQLWLCNPLGYRVQLLSDYVKLRYNRSIKGGGGIEVELPANFDTRYLRDLSYLEVWERVGDRALKHVDVFVVQSIPQSVTARGTRFLTLEGPTATDYFVGKNSRVVDALEGAAGATYTDNTDDLMRQFVADQLGYGAGNSGTSEGRDLSVYAGFSVEAARNMGPSVTVNGFFRSLDEVLTEIANKSEQNTSSPLRLFWYVRAKSFNPLRFEFMVLPRYYGRDRGFTSASPVILAPALSNVSQVEIEHDYREAWNAVYVAYNLKTGDSRVVSTTRRNIAPQAYREVYFNAANATTSADALIEAQGKLAEGEERKLARVKVVDNAVMRYRAEYDLGDVVGTLFLGRRANAEVASEEVTVDASGAQVSLKLDEV